MRASMAPRAALPLTGALLAACTAGGDRPATAGSDDGSPATDPVLAAQTYIHAPYDSVWTRFTEVDAFADWFSAPGLAFGDTPGDSLAWGEPGAPVYGGMLERLEKGRGLAFTFAFTFVDPPEESRVEVDIVEQGEVVWVRLRHDCRDAPRTAGIISPVGWTKSLSRLKTLLETGRPMPWPDDGG